MEIRTLQTFQVVAEELNLTRAAIKLNYSQPTVTKHIKSLEDSLGTILLEKRDGHYVLTYAGEQLYKRAINILKEVNMIKGIPSEYGANEFIHLQGHDYYCFHYLLPAIRQMSRQKPTASFKLKGSTNEETISQLLKNEIDIGIVSGNIASSDLIYDVIDYESVALVIHTQYYRSSYHLEDYFERYPVIVDQSECYNYHNSFKQSLNTPQIIDTTSDEVVQQAVLNNAMLGIVRTGRIQPLIDTGKVAIIKELTMNEPVNVVINKASSHHESILLLYSLIKQQTNFFKQTAKVQWI
jgi:Transcriptional regulator